MQALDPLQAEAQAVLEAMRYVMQGGNQGDFTIFSDNKNMVKAIKEGDITDLVSWRAAEMVMNAVKNLREGTHRMTLQYITRKALQTPHNLANWARKSGKAGNGTPIRCSISHL